MEKATKIRNPLQKQTFDFHISLKPLKYPCCSHSVCAMDHFCGNLVPTKKEIVLCPSVMWPCHICQGTSQVESQTVRVRVI